MRYILDWWCLLYCYPWAQLYKSRIQSNHRFEHVNAAFNAETAIWAQEPRGSSIYFGEVYDPQEPPIGLAAVLRNQKLLNQKVYKLQGLLCCEPVPRRFSNSQLRIRVYNMDAVLSSYRPMRTVRSCQDRQIARNGFCFTVGSVGKEPQIPGKKRVTKLSHSTA